MMWGWDGLPMAQHVDQSPKPTRTSYWAPLLVLLIGFVLTALTTERIHEADEETLAADLDADAAQLGLLIQSMANGFETDLTSTVGVALATDGDEAIYRARIDDGTGGDRVLVEMQPEVAIRVLISQDEASAEAAFSEILEDQTVLSTLQDLAERGEFGFVTLGMDDSNRSLLIAAGASDADKAFVELRRFDLGSAGPAIVSLVDGIDHFAVYISDTPDPSTAVLASTLELPLVGTVATTTTDLGGQTLYIEVLGDVQQVVAPWILLATGAVLSGMLAGLLLVSQRRRDRAIDALEAAAAATEARAKLEAELQQAQRMEAVGQLAGGIAHDFNNLLAAITSTVELVADDVTDPLMREDLEEIRHAARRGAALTRRLLSFSRRDVEARELLDVNHVVTDVAPLLRRSLTEDIALEIDLDPRPLPVLGDAGEIEQVLLNLVVNARDATQGGGRIRLTSSVDAGSVHLAVADTGAGMPPDVAARAFEPFFSTKAKSDGTGLGLAIVYGIATRMDGNATIESEPGQGTTVTVSLPLAQGSVPHVDESPIADAAFEPGPVSERILLVEDEPAVRRAARRLLERGGHTVIDAGHGEEAVATVLNGFEPTVLVTDVILPGGLNGRDVADRVRAIHPGVRVVFASGYPSEIVEPSTLAAGDSAFVSKPFSADALLDAVRGTEVVA